MTSVKTSLGLLRVLAAASLTEPPRDLKLAGQHWLGINAGS